MQRVTPVFPSEEKSLRIPSFVQHAKVAADRKASGHSARMPVGTSTLSRPLMSAIWLQTKWFHSQQMWLRGRGKTRKVIEKSR